MIVPKVPAERFNHIVQRASHAHQAAVSFNMREHCVLIVTQFIRANFDFNRPKDTEHPALPRYVSRAKHRNGQRNVRPPAS
jgi:hypothetical protein